MFWISVKPTVDIGPKPQPTRPHWYHKIYVACYYSSVGVLTLPWCSWLWCCRLVDGMILDVSLVNGVLILFKFQISVTNDATTTSDNRVGWTHQDARTLLGCFPVTGWKSGSRIEILLVECLMRDRKGSGTVWMKSLGWTSSELWSVVLYSSHAYSMCWFHTRRDNYRESMMMNLCVFH